MKCEDNLVDIKDIKIDMSTSIEKRRESYIKQIKNPYQFKYNDIIISLEYAGDKSLQEKFVSHYKNK